jgi:8-hydroxy-5-deazaflavin:NADPH oxidoreductase
MEPFMANDPTSKIGRREFLDLAAGGFALGVVAASPFAALAQAAGGAPLPLKIGTIGAGREGGALGTQFAKAGHPVMEVGCGTCNGCSPARSSA